MVRQCAWCLRLIDSVGGYITALPQPKLYEATHVMCTTCGTDWIEQVMQSQQVQATLLTDEEGQDDVEVLSQEVPTLSLPHPILQLL